MNKSDVQKLVRDHKAYLTNNYSVEKIGLFGSFARNENTEESDIDLLVEFNKPVGLEFFDLKEYLESIFNKPVDLVTVRALKPYMKDQILSEVLFQ